LIKDGDRWATADPRSWGLEADLEDVLLGNPYLVPGCQGSAVVRQFRIPGVGTVDLVCVDDLGVITLIECKLAKNAEIRRAVVGQIFAYASGLSGMSDTDFSAEFERRTGVSLLSAVSAAAGSDVDAEEFAGSVGANLAAGRFRLVVAVDAITPELQAIIEYLNVHLGDTVALMAFELGRVVVGGTAVLIPATYGAEVAERKKNPPGARRRWSEADLVEATESVVDLAARRFVEELLTYAEKSGAVIQGGSGKVPSAGFYYVIDGTRVSIWSLYVGKEDPLVAFNLGSIERASKDLALDTLAALRTSPAIATKLPADDENAVKRYTEFPIRTITGDPTALQAFWSAIELAANTPRT
jgi:hypothetical protein